MDLHDEKWFRERLQRFIKERHPQRSIHTEAVERRSHLAAASYAGNIACNGNPTQALRSADEILFRGLLFSPYDTIHLILETDFPAIPENKRRDVAIQLLRTFRPVFLLYNLGDDFVIRSEFKQLKEDLRTCVRFWIDENDIPGYLSGVREQKPKKSIPYSRRPKYAKRGKRK